VNRTQETACELAGGGGHHELADALEALVLFNESLEEATVEEEVRGASVSEMDEEEFEPINRQEVMTLASFRSKVAGENMHVSSKWTMNLLSACNWNIKQV
jgi:hypothetical protein